MERDFEQELKQLKQSEVPDLWNRIEAALPEKKAVVPSLKDTAVSEKEQENAGKRERLRKIEKISWKKWGTLAAACLCLVIVLPAVITLIGSFGGSKSDSSSSAANDSAMSEGMFASADEAASDAAASEESVTAGAAESSVDMTQESAPAGASDASAATAADDSGSNSDGLGKVESASEEPSEAVLTDSAAGESENEKKSSSEEKQAYILTDGQILQGMYIHVTETERAEEETIFHAIVIQTDEEAILEEGTELKVVCDSRTEYSFPRAPREDETLKKGENYEVSLCYETDAQGEGKLVVLSAAQ